MLNSLNDGDVKPDGWRFESGSFQFVDPETGEPLGFSFNPEERVFHTSSGTGLHIGRLNDHAITMFVERFTDKHEPDIPKRPIEYEPGKFFLKADSQDEAYQRAYERFEMKLSLAMAQFAIVSCVKNHMPTDIPHHIQMQIEMSGAESETEIKYIWITSVMQSSEERSAFMACLNGQTLPTPEAIATAEQRFPGNGEPNAGKSVPDSPAAGTHADNASL